MSERDEKPAVKEDSTLAPEGPEESGAPLLAIGFPVGWMIAILGSILVLYGLLGSPENARSLGININLWWGLVMVVFGAGTLGLSHASSRRQATGSGRSR